MKKRKYIICLFSITVLIVSGITLKLLLNKQEKVTYLSASWSYNYNSIEVLSSFSDLIAVIHVNKLIEYNKNELVSHSIFEAEVLEAVYGCNVGDRIPVYMTGYDDGKEKFEIKDSPLLEVGQELLVFTRKNEDGTYTMLEPQGRFQYKDGKINSLNYVYENIGPSTCVDIKDKDAEILINEIKEIKNAE